jgi:serine/threonine-protein phosphatase Stp1
MLVASPWRSAARTDPGKVRARNEDAFLDSPQQGLWVVADGMGGHQGGDIASQLIVASLAELPQHEDFDERLKAIRQCLHWLNRRLGQELTVTAGRHDSIMGSTVVALLVEGNRAACIWAGDSRCYLARAAAVSAVQGPFAATATDRRATDERRTGGSAPGGSGLDPSRRCGRTTDPGCPRTRGLSGRCVFAVQRWFVSGPEQRCPRQRLSLSAPHVALERLFDGALRGAARDNLTAVVIRQ